MTTRYCIATDDLNAAIEDYRSTVRSGYTAPPRIRPALFRCQECGKGFKSHLAAARAASDGCPRCGGVDIDLA